MGSEPMTMGELAIRLGARAMRVVKYLNALDMPLPEAQKTITRQCLTRAMGGGKKTVNAIESAFAVAGYPLKRQ